MIAWLGSLVAYAAAAAAAAALAALAVKKGPATPAKSSAIATRRTGLRLTAVKENRFLCICLPPQKRLQ
jgi:hypothetical protein